MSADYTTEPPFKKPLKRHNDDSPGHRFPFTCGLCGLGGKSTWKDTRKKNRKVPGHVEFSEAISKHESILVNTYTSGGQYD
ncbi:hypothetical protein Ciccas_002418 [Cichlidogyrus casuarinus]|uniref:Uncharacterized protein n=1 Tax=Cichlidogyrus casuarinus TaxID=1844966 RepID=A0ABD2QJJ4_9PLAT